MSGQQVFQHRYRSGGFYAFLIILSVFPVFLLTNIVGGELALTVGSVTVLLITVTAGAVWVLIRNTVAIEIDDRVLRCREQESYFGIAGQSTIAWEVPLADLTSAKEVHTKTPSSRGGWNHGWALHLPGKRQIVSDLLGGKDDPKSEYNRLVAWLEARLGDAFTREETT